MPIADSELIINPDGSAYHLHIKPQDVADNIILVGDPERVELVSSFFNKVEFKIQNREFVTHSGTYKDKQVSVISTGIGTDNIDIVLNELDAACNVDLNTRTIKEQKKSLKIVRIGTSGGLQPETPVGSAVLSRYSVGIDGLINFYQGREKITELEMENQFIKHTNWNPILARPYIVGADENLSKKIAKNDLGFGLTIAAPGFYGPQGRIIRLPIIDENINTKLQTFEYKGLKILNYEMETSAVFGLSKLLGHQATAVCLIIANRFRKEFCKDYKKSISGLIELVLNRICE